MLSRVKTPNTANIPDTTACTSRIGALRASRSPTNTAGTSAISIPSVLPATTDTRSC
jgi:hypothetical protein